MNANKQMLITLLLILATGLASAAVQANASAIATPVPSDTENLTYPLVESG